ncbi:hypothetical protein [Photobacterium kishitanii]|uniref:Uncharacterized protein n=1 Tax=Photobacterium kishitanii TaxID=318456 RepID=A0A2T3KKS7_9GAMM|nr:hypothetical protein [Photobacterium kishitanii]PSV00312.1 hypothetical protein C9J27_04090 [Photobacterium kishitanii]
MAKTPVLLDKNATRVASSDIDNLGSSDSVSEVANTQQFCVNGKVFFVHHLALSFLSTAQLYFS